MRIPKFVPEISRPDRLRISISDALHPEERREQRQVARHWVMEPRQESVDRMDAPVGIHEEASEAGSGTEAFWRPRRFEGPDDRRADGDDPTAVRVRTIHGVSGLRGHGERLWVQGLPFHRLALDLEARDAGVEEDRCDSDAGLFQGLSDRRRD